MEAKKLRTEAGMGRQGGAGEMAPPPGRAGAGGGPCRGPRCQHWTHCRVLDLHFSRAVSCLPFPTQRWAGEPFLSSGSLCREAPSTMINMTPGHPSPHSEFSQALYSWPPHALEWPLPFGQLHVNCLHGQRLLLYFSP